jgi:hypothetical protein
MGAFGVVSIAPSDPGFGDILDASGERAFVTSSAAATRQASRIALVSMTQVKSLPRCPPDLRPDGPLRSCAIMFPASTSEMLKTAARLARDCGETLATNSFPSALCPFVLSSTPLLVCPFVTPFVPLCASHGACNDGYVSSVVRTSVWDCSETNTASALVTHPEQARQSVSDIEAGGGGSEAAAFSSVVTSYGFWNIC